MTLLDHERRLSAARRAATLASDDLAKSLWEEHEITPKGTYDLHLTADAAAGPVAFLRLEEVCGCASW